jgi:pimeloyl-ACP methyl ester carboxylesterase
MHIFLLLHAPPSAPVSWQPVADALRSRGYPVVVPDLTRVADDGPPYWPRYGAAAGQALMPLPDDLSVVVVAHSGAGFFVPLLRQATGAAIPFYVFADAVVPEDGVIPDADGYMRSRSRDGWIPPFTEAELRSTGLPADAARALHAELRPLPLAVYEEPVPVFPGWPDAPRAYLRFTRTWPQAYQRYVDHARRESWPYAELNGGHFHMLVDPEAVAEAILTLVRQSIA